MHEPVLALAAVVILGIAAQWVAWRIKLPSILLLLLAGIVVGPITGWLDPDALFRDLLMPIVALSVGLILYEGGFTLRREELRSVGPAVIKLITVGAFITWALAGLAAWVVLGLELDLSILLGAVLVVTGPTVIQPLLRHIRPSGAVGGVLKWEGIVIDPVGALLALLVFEVIIAGLGGGHGHGAGAHGEAAALGASGVSIHAFVAVAKTIIVAGVAGGVFALILLGMLRRYWIPDFLGSAVSLAFALAAFTLSNLFQEESGLAAVTWMGLLLANQRRVDVEDIIEFKENLRVLLISGLFILLAARLPFEALSGIGWREVVFVGLLVLVVRPLSVAASTRNCGLSRAERFFLAWMAPRGIVAAAVSSIFSLRLVDAGVPGAETIATATFAVIIGTVLIYGLTSPIVARRLGLSEANPQGLLIVGVDRLTRAIARVIEERGFSVLLVDTNRDHTRDARMEGRRTYTGSVLAEDFLDEAQLSGIGRLLAMTPNDWVNVLAVHRLEKVFGTANTYQYAADHDSDKERESHEHLSRRILFGEDATRDHLLDWIEAGGQIKATQITEEYDFDTYLERQPGECLPLFVISASGKLSVVDREHPARPGAGDTVIALVDVDTDESDRIVERIVAAGDGDAS